MQRITQPKNRLYFNIGALQTHPTVDVKICRFNFIKHCYLFELDIDTIIIF